MRSKLIARPGCYLMMMQALVLVLLSPLVAVAQSPGDITITVEDYFPALLGGYIHLEITLENISDAELGGFDLLIEYDTTLLTFWYATQGQLLTDCGWEYFEVRNDTAGLTRIVGVGDIVNGDEHPGCYLENSQGTVAVLSFRVSGDLSLTYESFPVQFYWMDCGDNTVANRAGDTLFVSHEVRDCWYHQPIQEDDEFPTYKGAPDICVTGTSPRMVDFQSGIVEVGNSALQRGDLNLDWIAYEIPDYILYTQYFIYGLGVFTINVEGQVAASDVNADGLTLTVRDLIFLYRVIIGDVNPIVYRGIAGSEAETAVFVQDTIRRTVSVEYPDSLAAAWLAFDGALTPMLVASDMTLIYAIDGDDTFVLVYPSGAEKFSFSEGLLLAYSGSGVLTSVTVADYHEAVIPTDISVIAGYLCGDADGTGYFDIDDVVNIIAYVFTFGPPPYPLNAGDVDCSGAVDIDDIVYIIEGIFLEGPPPCDPNNDGIPDC